MKRAFDFCSPTRGPKVPHTQDWLHEIKHDGYRLCLERDGDRVRQITRNGYDWTWEPARSWDTFPPRPSACNRTYRTSQGSQASQSLILISVC